MTSKKRAILVIFVALMLVLAGCAGETDGDGNGNGADGGLGPDGDSVDDSADDDGGDDDSDGEPDDGDQETIDDNEETADSSTLADSLTVAEWNVEGVSPDEEYVVLENTGEKAIDFSGFELRDREGGQIDSGLSAFVFPTDFVLESGATVTIWTGEGDATASDLYWGYGVNIWRRSGDVVTLVDQNGEIVFEHAYGDQASDDTDDSDTAEDSEPDDSDSEPAYIDGELEIHHIDVGQTDATLLITPAGETILIDSGDWPQDGADVIAYLEDQGVDRIDHLVATHGHADHIGGHAAVIKYYETEKDGIGAAYDPGVLSESATYNNYLDAVDEDDVDLFVVEEGDELPIDDTVSATVLNPPEGHSGGDFNDFGIVLAFEFGDVRYLATGDIEEGMEARLVDERGSQLEADVYKVGHHGSASSSTEAFMDAVDPEIGIISSAYDSQYGHPHDEVLERLADYGIETYWTGVHGDIVVTTDGETIEVESSDAFSSDPLELLEEKPSDNDEEETSSITA